MATLALICVQEVAERPMRKVLIQEGRAEQFLEMLWFELRQPDVLDKELEYVLVSLAGVISRLSDYIPKMVKENFLDTHSPLAVVASQAAQRQLCQGNSSSHVTVNILHSLLWALRWALPLSSLSRTMT